MPQNKITLLNECVAQEDSYKNSTHQKIADTLRHIIESDNGAITIGLEGEWGSGKSTVVNFLEKEFKKKPDNNTLFFKFDAWNHDGDPLRITFLTNLINNVKNELTDEKSNKEVCEKLDYLLIKVTGKVKTITNTSVKTSTRFGKLLAASIMLVPIGSALFSKTYEHNELSFIPYEIYKEITSIGITTHLLNHINSFSLIPTAAVFLLLAPILLVCYWYLFGKEEHSKHVLNDEKDSKHVLDEKRDYKHDKWEFISSKSKDTVVQDIIEQGDKTSFEFEHLFTQLMDIIVGDTKPFSKAVFIIDNMDRISHDHAKNIWSILQVFITNNHPKSHLIWFIIPFDESAFRKMWPGDKIDDESKDFTLNSFTEKCFQLIIDVPTPITSNWIDYLNKMSEKAFYKWNDPNLSADFIKQYRDYFSTINHSPTPRSINNVINQVQALQTRFIHEKDITINAITIYSLLRRTKSKREIKDIILYPQSSTVNPSILKRVKAYEKELSSILFHMPYNGGLELLLDSEITTIINSNDESEHIKLVSLQADYGDAFWQAWDSYYQKFDYKSTSENVRKSKTFLHLVSTYLFEFKDEEPLSSYIKMLANSFIKDSTFIFEHKDYKQAYEYISNLYKLIPISNYDKIDVIKAKTSAFIASYLKIDDTAVYDLNHLTQDKTMSLISIKQLLALLNINVLVCNKINSNKEFSLWCNQQDLEGVVIPEVLPNSSAFNEITRNIFSENHLNEHVIKKLCGMAALNPKWDGWENAIENICEWAKKPVSIAQHGAWSNRTNIRSTDKKSIFFSLVQTLNSHSNNGVKDKITELISNDLFTSGLYHEFSENKNNVDLALLVKPLIKSGKIKPQPEIMNVINKLYEENDATCGNEV